MRVVATYNLKGGVGKTSTAVNLAYLAARDGWRTLLWDLDPQGPPPTASESVFTAADLLLVPTVPTPLSLRALAQLRRHLRKKDSAVRVLPFFCMVDRRKSLHRQICADRNGPPYPMLATEIPYSTYVERMTETRTPLPVLAPRTAATRAYRSLWSEIAQHM